MRRNAVHLIAKRPIAKPPEHFGIREIEIQHEPLSRRRVREILSRKEEGDIMCRRNPRTPQNQRLLGAPPHIHARHICGDRASIFLKLKRQALHAAAHVRVARRNPDPTSRRYRDHGRNAFKVAAITAEGASALILARTFFRSTSTTPEAELCHGRGVGDASGAVSMITGENPQAPAL
jgi:hypothetical protein